MIEDQCSADEVQREKELVRVSSSRDYWRSMEAQKRNIHLCAIEKDTPIQLV